MTFEPGRPTPPLAVSFDRQPDVVASLPPNAADKLRMLRDRVDDLHRLLPDFEDRRAAGEARLASEERLRRLTAHQQQGGFNLGPDDPRVKAAQRDLKTLTAEAKRLTDNYERKSAAWREASTTLSNVESWLSGGKPSGVVLRDHAEETLKLPKDEDVLTFIERQRRRVREARAALHTIESSPFPSAYCKRRMIEQITALAERGRPSVSRLVEHDAAAGVDFADEHRTVSVTLAKEATVVGWMEPDALALVCWLHKDALIARLDEEIISEADDDSALSHQERERRAAEVQSSLLATERIDCAATWLAMSQNLPVEFRPDTNPVALLNVALVVAQAVPSRGSSIEHAISRVGG